MQTIDRDKVRSLLDDEPNTKVIEVLSEDYYEKFHLPGAENIPLDDQFDERIQRAIPDKSQPVVLYCFDQDCDASPKAARKMDELGYENVYDYEGGKMDWKEAGLPVES